MVGIVKQLMRKANQKGRDPHLALLEYCNTPISGLSYSPSQLLMSRMLRDKTPTSASLLKPKVPESAYDMLKLWQQKQKQCFDWGTRPLSKLEVGDSVRVKFGRTWTPGIISGKHSSPRSYLVTTENGRIYRRNCRVINPSTEPLQMSYHLMILTLPQLHLSLQHRALLQPRYPAGCQHE